MNEHIRYQELISRLLDEELSPEEQNDLALHLKDCPDCAAVYAAFSALSESMGSDLEEPPEGLRENVMAQIRREEIRRKNSKHAGKRWIPYLTVAAVAALVILAGPRLRMGSSGSAPVVTASYQASARSMPETEAAAAAGDSAEEDAAEIAPAEAAEVETAAAYAAADAGAPAVMADVGSSVNHAAMDGVQVLDLRGVVSRGELLRFLGGKDADLTAAQLDGELAYVAVTEDGEVDLYLHEGELIYLTAEEQTPQLAACGPEELLGFVQK